LPPLGRIAVPATFLLLAAAPIALAQKPATKNPKGAASATASASAAPAPTPTPTPAPEPAAPEAASAAPSASASVTSPSEWSTELTDVTENPNEKYYFIGATYRGTIIPQFMTSLFVDEGGTFYSNMVRLDLDMRKENHSLIPWLAFAEYGTGDTLFLQKGKDAGDPGNWSYVNSSLKAIYLGVDQLWSTPIANHFDFEYGFDVGIGFIFGDLVNNWVTPVCGNGPGETPCTDTLRARAGYVSKDGQYAFNPCKNEGDGPGCAKSNHQNADIAKVWGTNSGNPYVDKMWFSGGSIPNIFPYIGVPHLGVRYKPIKQFVARFGLGFSLTGFWFGIEGYYGLERPEKKEPGATKTGGILRFGDTH
jgi:hypothetical protein